MFAQRSTGSFDARLASGCTNNASSSGAPPSRDDTTGCQRWRPAFAHEHVPGSEVVERKFRRVGVRKQGLTIPVVVQGPAPPQILERLQVKDDQIAHGTIVSEVARSTKCSRI
jgi:hypothetical protein